MVCYLSFRWSVLFCPSVFLSVRLFARRARGRAALRSVGAVCRGLTALTCPGGPRSAPSGPRCGWGSRGRGHPRHTSCWPLSPRPADGRRTPPATPPRASAARTSSGCSSPTRRLSRGGGRPATRLAVRPHRRPCSRAGCAGATPRRSPPWPCLSAQSRSLPLCPRRARAA